MGFCRSWAEPRRIGNAGLHSSIGVSFSSIFHTKLRHSRCRNLVGLVGLEREARAHRTVAEDPHGHVGPLDALGDVGDLGRFRRIAHDRADDFQRFPGMLVVVGRVQLQPAQAAAPTRFRVLRREAFAFVQDARPLARGAFDAVVDRGQARGQRIAAAHFLAPVRERLRARRQLALHDLFARHAGAFRPVQPVFGVILLDADVAHEPAPRHVFTLAAAIARLHQTLRHVAGEALDGRPRADHEPRRDRRVLVRAHLRPQFVFDDGLLDDVAFADHVLRPLRIAAQFGQGPTTFKTHTHDVLLGSGRVFRDTARNNDGYNAAMASFRSPPTFQNPIAKYACVRVRPLQKNRCEKPDNPLTFLVISLTESGLTDQRYVLLYALFARNPSQIFTIRPGFPAFAAPKGRFAREKAPKYLIFNCRFIA